MMAGVSVDMSDNAKVIVLDVTGNDLEFSLPPPYAVDVLVGVWDEAAVNIDASIDVLSAVMTALGLTISPSLEVTLTFC